MKKYTTIAILVVILSFVGYFNQSETYYGITLGEELSKEYKHVQDNKYCKSDSKGNFDRVCAYKDNKDMVYKIELLRDKAVHSEEGGMVDSWMNIYKQAVESREELTSKYSMECNDTYHYNYYIGSTLIGFKCKAINKDTKITLTVVNPTGVNNRFVSITGVDPFNLIVYEKVEAKGL